MALIDSYSEDNYNNYVFQIYQPGHAYCGQCIQIGSTNYKLTSVTFFIYKAGSPTGNVYSKVWNATGTAPNMEPTGNVIAESSTKNAADLPSTYALQCDFTFSGDNQIMLNAGGKYYVACYLDGGDSSNTVKGCVDTESPTHPGNCYHENSGILSDVDCIFYLYGDIAAVSDSGSGSDEIEIHFPPTTKDATDITYDSAKLHGEASWDYSQAGFDYTDEQGSWKWSTV